MPLNTPFIYPFCTTKIVLGRPPKTKLKILQILRKKPTLTARQLAHYSHIKPSAANVARWRLTRLQGREYVIKKVCPNCNKKSLFIQQGEEQICTNCGIVYPLLQHHLAANPYGRGPVDALH